MKRQFHGYKRLTHRYIPAYKHLDKSAYVGLFGILAYGKAYEDDKYGDSWHYTVTIKAPKDAKPEDVDAVIRDRFNTGCSCEHDCCGHVSTFAFDVHHTKRREYVATISAGRNL